MRVIGITLAAIGLIITIWGTLMIVYQSGMDHPLLTYLTPMIIPVACFIAGIWILLKSFKRTTKMSTLLNKDKV